MTLRRGTTIQTVVVVLCAACADDQGGSVPAGPVRVDVSPPAEMVLVGAGNVARCGTTGAAATAALLDSIPGTVFTLGDNAYPDGTPTQYQSCYDPSWGRHKARTFPAPGNRDYNASATADGYFGYFGAAAGDPGKGYYSYDLGAWHVVVLNSNYRKVATAAGSSQEQWLKTDLAAHSGRCTLAMWHNPRFYSTTDTVFYPSTSVQPFWEDLYDAGADLILNAHMRDYERFAPQRPDGTPDSIAGIREIIVGTGGAGLDEPNTFIIPNSEVQISGVYGVLRLTLSDASYAWHFIPVAGASATDSGAAACHHAGSPPPPPPPSPANAPPVAVPGGPYAGVDTIRFDGSGSFDPDSNLPLAFAWTFGDASGGRGARPLHLYRAAGSYTVALTVTDARGATSPVATTTAVIQGRPVPPIVSGSCLNQTGPTVTLSGVQQSEYQNPALAPGTKIDASTAQFMTGTLYPFHVSGSNLCVHGGQVLGAWEPATPWRFMYTTYGVLVDSGTNVTVENVWIYNYGNGVSFQQNAPNWTVRSSYFAYGRDGCVENDFQQSGTVDDVLMDCYDPFASNGGYAVDGSANRFTVSNSLIHALPMDGVYSGSVPGTTGIFEWAGTSPQIALYNNVFRADQNSNELYLAPPPDKLVDCANNIMIWLGSGPFPEPLPATFNGKPCFTLMTGQAGVDYWNTVVTRWKASHATALPDIAPPVVSLFSPGVVGSTTLTGLVSLTATAADDHDVAAVQFQLDGRAIGSALTLDSPPTKYTLSWDSSSVPNGTYTLTATATDTAGNTTTSVGIAVTISN